MFRKNTPKAKETRHKELTYDFLNDLHNGRFLNENEYIDKMSISASVGGIWGDFTAVNWISDYLSTPITVRKQTMVINWLLLVRNLITTLCI